MLQLFSPWRLLGPLADKELRVASRRGRNYALRSGYILLLCMLMLSTWYSMVGMPSNSIGAFGVSRAAAVSTYVAMTITRLQLVAAQLIAAVMLSSSVGDEIRRGTLGVLLTTPITSGHIVAGKLLSGLLQVLLLLAISLPALAVLRALGGLSWDEVLAVSCITLTAALFAGALELLLSTYYRHSYQAISAGAVVYLVLFIGLPFAASYLSAGGVLSQPMTQSILDVMSPFRALYRVGPWVWRARTAGPSYFSWPIHCLIMVGATAIVSFVAIRRIRRVAAGGLLRAGGQASDLRRLHRALVAWREDRDDWLWRKRTVLAAIGVPAICILLGATSGPRNAPVMVYSHYAVRALWLLAFLRLAISAAGGITREKESGAWQVLLTTPLPEGQILRVKAIGSLRRNAVLLLSLLAVQTCFVLFQSAAGKEMTAAISGLFRLGSVFFILGAGLYFGVRLRTTTLAVAATMIAFLGVDYLLAGSYNPLFALLWAKLIRNAAPQWSNYLMVIYYLSTMGTAFVLDIALGLFLWRRARRNVRLYVF